MPKKAAKAKRAARKPTKARKMYEGDKWPEYPGYARFALLLEMETGLEEQPSIPIQAIYLTEATASKLNSLDLRLSMVDVVRDGKPRFVFVLREGAGALGG